MSLRQSKIWRGGTPISTPDRWTNRCSPTERTRRPNGVRKITHQLANTIWTFLAYALDAGASQLDGCCAGLGAGAGNCPTEVLVATCDKLGLATGVDPLEAMGVAEDLVRPLRPEMGVIDRAGLLLGYAGVYGSFLLHAQRAAARYGVDVGEILLELGRRPLEVLHRLHLQVDAGRTVDLRRNRFDLFRG